MFPHVKWGQTKEKVFVTFLVRDLDQDSVRLEFGAEHVRFAASDHASKEYALELQLDQDVETHLCKWEWLQRKHRLGDGVVATLTKVFPAAWPTLAVDQGLYPRQVIERDWNRDDAAVTVEEDNFFEEHAEYLPRIHTKPELLEEMSKEGVEAVVLLARHNACDQCSVAEKTFAAAAKEIQRVAKTTKVKKMDRLRRSLTLRVVDLKAARQLRRHLQGHGPGLKCAPTPRECRYYVFSQAGGLAPVPIRGRHDEAVLLENLKLIARPQFFEVSGPLEPRSSTRSRVVLRNDASETERQAAHQQRLRLDVGVAKAEAQDLLGLAQPRALAWRGGEEELRYFDGGNFTVWLQNVALPCVGDVKSFTDEEPYEDLSLPIARLYLDGGQLDIIAKKVLCRLSGDFFGQMTFMAKNASQGSSDWRQHGLPPGNFPAVAAASGPAFNASKFAFLEMPKKQSEDFWKSAHGGLSDFFKAVLAGRLEPSKMSENPIEDDQEPPVGSVRKLVGRRCREVVEESPSEVLIEGFDEWRRDHPRRTLQLDLLSPMLAEWNITVYRLDFGANECPSDVLRSISAGYSGYFFAHAHARQRGRKLQRLKKLDPDFTKVMSFVQKHSETAIVASEVLGRLNAAVAVAERSTQPEALTSWWPLLLSLLGIVLALFSWLRSGGKSTRHHSKVD